MKKVSEYLFLWALGGTLYYGFEVFFRGFSHWSMFILGGVCFCFIAWQGRQVHWIGPTVAPGHPLCDLCDGSRIFYGSDRK